MMDIQKSDASPKIEQLSIKGSGTKIAGIYYYIVPNEEQQNIQTQLKEHLAIK